MAAANRSNTTKADDPAKTEGLQATPHTPATVGQTDPTETGQGPHSNAGVVHTHAGAPDAPVPTPQAAPKAKAKYRVELTHGIHHEGGVTYEKGAVFNSITDLATRFPEKFRKVPASFESGE